MSEAKIRSLSQSQSYFLHNDAFCKSQAGQLIVNMGPSSDHWIRLLELGIRFIIRHDEYQVRGKEADKIILRVF